MKKAFLLLCAVLLVLGSVLPLAGYRLAETVWGRGAAAPPSPPPESAEPAAPEPVPDSAPAPSTADAETFLLTNAATGEVFSLSRRDYLIGAVAAEMPVSWPDEALKAQAIAAHSYLLYCRDHSAQPEQGWLSVDPARRQGCLTEPVLRSYWGTAYDANYTRLSALVDQVTTKVLYYEDAPAGTSYFAISNGRTEASENVWGAPLPYLVPVDSATDQTAENFTYTITLTADQMQAALTETLGLAPDGTPPERWFGQPTLTASGYVASIPLWGQSVTGPALRRSLGLRSACFSIEWGDGNFTVTTQGYGHGVGLSQWGAKALAEQGASCQEILAHYFPHTELRE